MTKEEYEEYKLKVESFFETEGINNLSAVLDDTCSSCEEYQEIDPYFSYSSCDCCGSRLGGKRYHANGYNPNNENIQCYEVCVDCIYYAEYGQLDDIVFLK